MHYLFSLLFWMFIVGVAGSAVVILLTFVDDLSEIFTADRPAESTAETLQPRTVPVQ